MPGDSGNRSSTSNTLRAITAEIAQYNQDDQLTQKGSDTYQYDANGRLSSKTTAQGTTTYQYGTRGELLSAQTPDTLVEYLHNPLGQRIARKVNGQIVEKYHWLNLTTLLATYDANGNVLQRYEYAGGRTPTKLTQGTQTYYILSDYQGTPKLVTDTTGAVVKELSYDSFGNVIQDSNPTFRLPFGYAGGLYDPETQLIRFGHRDYDPDAGRWTARDPIGFGGGDTNLYGYVLGDPVSGSDPTGLLDRLLYDGTNLTGFDDFAIEFQVPAVSGPYGKGHLPEGIYTADNLRKRSDSAAMKCGDSGWSLDLTPTFETDRTLLRIHPDGNVPGTLGCVGTSCSHQKEVYDALRNYFADQNTTPLPLEVEYPNL